MRALKLVQHMQANADPMCEGLVRKIRSTDRCRELLLRLPVEEHKRSALEIYRNLIASLTVRCISLCLGYQKASKGEIAGVAAAFAQG